MFEAVYEIHRKCLIACKINVRDFLHLPAVTHQLIIYFPIAGKFDRDYFSTSVFAVNIGNLSADELIQKADCRLCYVIAIRYDIIHFSHMVQVFDQTDIILIRDFPIVLL